VKIHQPLFFIVIIAFSCDNISSNCNSAIWTSFINKDGITLTKYKTYRLSAIPLVVSFNARIDRGLAEGHTLRENRVVGYIDSSSDSLQISCDGVLIGPLTQKESYTYFVKDSTLHVDTVFTDKGYHIDSTNHVFDVELFHNQIKFGYYMDSTNMYRYIVHSDFTPSCVVNTTNLSNEVIVTIIPDDSIHTIIKLYATIEEGYGHLNDLSVRDPITFLIDDRP